MDQPAPDLPTETRLVDVSDRSLLQLLAEQDPVLQANISSLVALLTEPVASQGWNSYLDQR